jgi:hypothetical protein
MNLCVFIITKNTSIAVRTLHNLLNLNMACMQNNIQIELNFVSDNPFEYMQSLMKKLKTSDRILFIDYAVSLDIESIKKVVSPFEPSFSCMVFPGVTQGIDWDMFKNKVMSDTKEPLHQAGLNFDTQVSKQIKGDIYRVTKTNPKAWAIDSKQIIKKLKGKKGEPFKLPAQIHELFEKFLDKGVNVCAFTDAQITITYQHECLSNILNSAGIIKD